jgi:hypothetical protein
MINVLGGQRHGRGLLIVSQLAGAWGRDGSGAVGWTVWFEMDCRGFEAQLLAGRCRAGAGGCSPHSSADRSHSSRAKPGSSADGLALAGLRSAK